ncbi:uncharacterized protein LOC117303677 [Asterias rubens]|uniref:uncharacterized protein LOC117303677 n=1 Tax=Asterias rubens TaxID=7604 RepID=UPI001454FAA7|nr:uncharacterized protein LOC117303677 [Asterias rubens]
MADRVGFAGDENEVERGEMTSPTMGDGSLLRSKDEWGSIIDILKNIENTTQPVKPVSLPPVPAPAPPPRLAPLSENIQSTEMMSPGDGKRGQGLQHLDHLVRMMEQMCQLQKQNSQLRERAEYLAAIKDLQELRNESLVQNCKCEAQRRSSDISRIPDETFSEPESTVGDEMEPRREPSPTREKRPGRSIKREPKTKSMKKRSRSLDPYRKDTAEPREKEGERERGRPGIFSKFERMKEKLTTRRGSVKKHNTNKRTEDNKHDDDLRAERPEAFSNEHFNLQMDGTETKSEDSGIYHVGLDEIVNLPRLPAEILPKLHDDLSDNEDVFAAHQPSSWTRTNDFSMETRKGSDFSTESSSEDYLEVKPKRANAAHHEEPVKMRSPDRQRHREDSKERDAKSSDEKEQVVHRKMRVRRSASLQDSISLNSDDDEFETATKASWESKEAPAIMQRSRSDKMQLERSPSNDFDLSDISLTGHDSASTSSLESKAAHKRKYFRKSHHIEEPTSPIDQRFKTVAFELKSPKESPPEKKRHKVGWEKVKHAVTRKHIGELGKTKGTVSMDESILRSSEEPSSPTDSSPPEDSYGKVKRSEVRKVEQKREKERGQPPPYEAQQSPLAIYESLQANLSEDFAKKMEKWDRKKQKQCSSTGVSPLERTKQSSLDSCSSDAGTLPTSDLEAELQKGLTEDFYKKLAEWDKLKHHKGVGAIPTSPKGEPKHKQKIAKDGKKTAKSTKSLTKDKERDKNKVKDTPQQRSKSPESSAARKVSPPPDAIYATEHITVFAKQGGKLKLEGASKEFSKKYKEWEKKEKKKRSSPALRTEDISSPLTEQAVPLPGYFTDGTPPTPSSPTANDPSETDNLYVIAHATPVIVEPDFEHKEVRHARSGDPIFRTQSAPPATVSNFPAVSQGDLCVSQQTVLEEDHFNTEPVNSQIPKERVDRLEKRNSFLAEQLKMDDVNLQAVQEEIVNVEEQLAEITGEPTDFTPVPITAAAEVQTEETQSADQETPCEKTRSDPTEALEKSLQEREAIIKLLQARLDRQALEINYLKNGSDAASMFRRAKSFTAKDKKTFDPRSMKLIDILQEKPEGSTDNLHSENQSESSKSLKTDSTPSLETLHISAEDIRMDTAVEEKLETQENKEKKEVKSGEIKPAVSTEVETPEVPAAEAVKQPSASSEVETRASLKEYPGLYGPIETKPKRRRPRSIEPPLCPPEETQTQESHAAVDSLLAKKEEDQTKTQESRPGSLSPRSPLLKKSRDSAEGEAMVPLSPTSKKVMPKIELVKLADGLKSQAVELSPRTKRKQDMAGEEDKGVNRKSPRGGQASPRGARESPESVSSGENKENKPAEGKDEKPRRDVKEHTSPVRQANLRKDDSPERSTHRSRRSHASRTLSSEILPIGSLRSSSREKEPMAIRLDMERRTSVEDLRAAIEKRQRTFSSDTVESDPEPQNNTKFTFETRRTERRESSDSLVSTKQTPEKREPVLMRSQKPEEKSVSTLRRKFVSQDYGSTPNVADLSTLTGRKGKERPREGCVKQMSQAFSLVSLNDQPGDVRRSSKSSSVRSSPQSLSPASSNSSISNIVANQIKRLQEKASSSPESPERRPSIQSPRGIKDTSPSLYSIKGRLEHRQSLTNVADVRAKFDKKGESPSNTDSSPSPSATSSPAQGRRTRKDNNAKPTLVSSVAAARIKYTVSVSNSEDNSAPKKSVSMRENGNAKTQRLVAVLETPKAEKTRKSDSSVTTFTVNQSQKRRQNSSSTRLEENNNNSNNNNRNYSARVDVRRKGSCTKTAEVSSKATEDKQGKFDKDNDDRGPSRRGSVTRSDKRRNSLSKQNDLSRDTSRRGSLTKGKESPKEAARKRSVSKESQKTSSRRRSLSKSQDSINEGAKGKVVAKGTEPSKETPALRVPEAEPEEDERGRRRRRRRERNNPSPDPTKAAAKIEEAIPEAKAEVKGKPGSKTDVKVEVKPKVKSDVKQEIKKEFKDKEGNVETQKINQQKVKQDVKHTSPPKVKPELGKETKQKVSHVVKSDVKQQVKPEVKAEVKPEVKSEVKPDRVQERKNRREERARRQKEREDEAARVKAEKEKEEAARVKAEKEKQEAARVKAEKEKEEAKKTVRVERKETQKDERREMRKEKMDLKKSTTEQTRPGTESSGFHGIRRRHSKREEQKPWEVPSKAAPAAVSKTEEEEPMPDLLAQAQKKTAGEASTAEDVIGGRSPRAILTNSALRGAEAVIGHALPKSPTDEEEVKEDPADERRSRKDATRRSRAINRGSRISRLDIFKRARSVDSSKGSKERSPDRLGGGGASNRACSVDRSGKNRDKSPGGEETRKGGSWLSKRTGSISNFLRPSNIDDQDIWEELDERYQILQSCKTRQQPADEYEDKWQPRGVRESNIFS